MYGTMLGFLATVLGFYYYRGPKVNRKLEEEEEEEEEKKFMEDDTGGGDMEEHARMCRCND